MSHDALEDLYKQLIKAWDACHQQSFQWGLDRTGCEIAAWHAHQRLEAGEDLPPVLHPAARLMALDTYLAATSPERKPYKPAGTDAWVMRRLAPLASRSATRDPNQPQFWMRNHQIVPATHRGIEVVVVPAPTRLTLRHPFGVGAGGFDDGVEPNWTEQSPHDHTGLTYPLNRRASVLSLLKSAAKRGATLVVMPELSIEPSLHDDLLDTLKDPSLSTPMWVVAGDCYVSEGPSRRNRAHLFGGGRVLLTQDKLVPMRRTDSGGTPIDEGCEAGTQLRLLHTDAGLLAIAICLDFCQTGDVPMATVWNAVAPAVVLVPSMGEKNTNDAHLARAQALYKLHGTRTAVASQPSKRDDRPRGLAVPAKPKSRVPVLWLTWS
jgi:hypothetical protein